MDDLKNLPRKRFTRSRSEFWKGLFNEFSEKTEDHSISGWSAAGLRQRYEAYRAVIPRMKLPEKPLVLDLGCGSGIYSRYHDAKGARAVGLDYAIRVLIKARHKTGPSNIQFLAGDAGMLPFKREVFDHVLCIGLFQSLDEHRNVIQEIYRILKNGGSVCIMTLNKLEINTRINRALNREEIIVVNGKKRPRLNTYNPHQFLHEIQKAGFRQARLSPVQILPEKLAVLKKFVPLWNSIPVLSYLSARSFMITAWRPVNE